MISKTMIPAALLAVAATSAATQDAGELSVGVGVTNYGASLSGEYTVSDQLGLRAMVMGGLNVDGEFDVDDATVDGEAELGGFSMIADYYPLANAWRVSGGLFLSNSEVAGEVTDSGLTYEGEVNLVNDVAPIVTTGFKTQLGTGWSVSGDVGVIFSSLEVTSDDLNPLIQAEIDELNAELEDLPVVPFVGLAVGYSF